MTPGFLLCYLAPGVGKRALIYACLVFLFLFALRLYHARQIYENRAAYFWGDGVPILSALDGYHFLRLGELLREGAYDPGGTDPLRDAPDSGAKLPLIPPLLSCLLALLSFITGVPPDRAFLAFPLIPFLASLLAFPLFFLGRRLWGDLSGLGMALGGGLSLEYLIRTDILRLDTDALNPFFLFLIAYILLRLLDRYDLKGLILLSLSVHLFYWWYRHPGLVIPLLVFAGLGFLLEGVRIREALGRTALMALFSNPWILYEGLWNLLGMFRGYIPGLLPEQLGFIPRGVFAQSVSELRNLPFWDVLGMTATHPLAGLLGLAGFGFLAVRRRKAVVLLPLFLLGLMSFFSGRRFIVYLGPFIGLGVGVLLDYCLSVFSRHLGGWTRSAVAVGLSALVFLATVSPYRFSYRIQSPINPALARGFEALRRLTPEGAAVWAWWDYGYPIAQIARRAVYHDGGSWGGPKSVLVARTFVAEDLETAYNVINGTTALGAEGIRELLERGERPKEIIEALEGGHYNRDLEAPVYLVVVGLDVPKFYWISFFGTWDPEKGEGRHIGVSPLGLCKAEGERVLCQRAILDLSRSEVLLPRGEAPLGGVKFLGVLDDTTEEERELRLGKGFWGLIVRRGGLTWGYLVHPDFLRTAFYRLFFLGDGGKFLKQIFSDFPHMRVFEVRACPPCKDLDK